MPSEWFNDTDCTKNKYTNPYSKEITSWKENIKQLNQPNLKTSSSSLLKNFKMKQPAKPFSHEARWSCERAAVWKISAALLMRAELTGWKMEVPLSKTNTWNLKLRLMFKGPFVSVVARNPETNPLKIAVIWPFCQITVCRNLLIPIHSAICMNSEIEGPAIAKSTPDSASHASSKMNRDSMACWLLKSW